MPEPVNNNPEANDPSRYDRRLAEIIDYATEVFYEKGYEGASMRDLSRASGMSLAGLYYYFESKEKLLYLIQRHTFETIIDRLAARLREASEPEEKLRAFIGNHLEYFLDNRKAMTVLSHEAEVLTGDLGAEVAGLKRRYYLMCREILEGLASGRGVEINMRVAVLSLFGMVNWIYTWYRPQVDGGAAGIANSMADIFLNGVLSSATNDGSKPELPVSSRSKGKKDASAASRI